MKTSHTLLKSNKKSDPFLFLLVGLILVLQGCSSEDDPTPVKYKDTLYNANTITNSNGTYSNGMTFVLYNPENNTDTDRPLILLSPGGGFTRYTRVSELSDLCTDLARRGYVVAMAYYSVTDTPGADIWVKSSIDQKNAIRYFRKRAADYGIDPGKIFIGGWSTGALISMTNAVLEDGELSETQNEALRNALTDAQTKYESYNTDTEYSHDVKGALCMAGWAFELNFFDAGDPALMLINHDNATLTNGVSIWGNFLVDGIQNYGFDKIRDRLIDVGYVEGDNLGYIRMSGALTLSKYGTVESLSPKNYNAIASFFYKNTGIGFD